MLNVIITGATGFVGEGVLLECLKSDKVGKILSVSRRPSGRKHEKLEELIIPNFKDLPLNDERFKGYNACFYCAGKSVNGLTEEQYRDITIETPLHFSKAIGENKEDYLVNEVTEKYQLTSAYNQKNKKFSFLS